MRTVMVLLAVSLPISPSLLSAQVAPVTVVESSCRADVCHTYTAHGSAVYVGQTSDGVHWFLSAGHLFSAIAPAGSGTVERTVSLGVDGRRVMVEVVRTRSGNGSDLALLGTANVRSGVCLPLAGSPPVSGQEAELAGYPLGGPFRVVRARIVDSPFPDYPLVADRRPTEGDSGGAVVVNGEVVGIVSGYPVTGREYCLFADAAAARRFLYESLGELPRCPRDR